MVKQTLFYLFQLKSNELQEREEDLKNMVEKSYSDLDDYGKAFQTLTRLIGEIEHQAEKEQLYQFKEILEPDDEGYVEPTKD